MTCWRRQGPDKIQAGYWITESLLDDIETIAISYEEMDYEIERDMVDDEGRFEGALGLKSYGLGRSHRRLDRHHDGKIVEQPGPNEVFSPIT